MGCFRHMTFQATNCTGIDNPEKIYTQNKQKLYQSINPTQQA